MMYVGFKQFVSAMYCMGTTITILTSIGNAPSDLLASLNIEIGIHKILPSVVYCWNMLRARERNATRSNMARIHSYDKSLWCLSTAHSASASTLTLSMSSGRVLSRKCRLRTYAHFILLSPTNLYPFYRWFHQAFTKLVYLV